MRCNCCDRPLSDAESVMKFKESGTYVDMCGRCRKDLPPELVIISSLEEKEEEEILDDDFDFEAEDGNEEE